jgi:hypothetical protein
MAGTRSSTRNAGNSSSPSKNDDAAAGSKRKPEAEPSPKRSRKATKKQATLEESGITRDEDSEMKDASASDQGDKQSEPETIKEQTPPKSDETDATKEDNASNSASKEDTSNNDTKEEQNEGAAEVDATNGDGAIEQSSQREKEIPSNILEKGLIYFFTRNRVGIDDADSVGDLQRTFFVLRPLPTGAKLGDGAIPDLKNNRLFALPKKTFPKSHNDRFMAFVEKANTTIQDLKDNFCRLSLYNSQK